MTSLWRVRTRGSIFVCDGWRKIRCPSGSRLHIHRHWREPLLLATKLCSHRAPENVCDHSPSKIQHRVLHFRQSLYHMCGLARTSSQIQSSYSASSPQPRFTLLRHRFYDHNLWSAALFIIPYFTAPSQIPFLGSCFQL